MVEIFGYKRTSEVKTPEVKTPLSVEQIQEAVQLYEKLNNELPDRILLPWAQLADAGALKEAYDAVRVVVLPFISDVILIGTHGHDIGGALDASAKFLLMRKDQIEESNVVEKEAVLDQHTAIGPEPPGVFAILLDSWRQRERRAHYRASENMMSTAGKPYYAAEARVWNKAVRELTAALHLEDGRNAEAIKI